MLKCPKCGSVVFVRVGLNRWRCVICGYEVVLGFKNKNDVNPGL